MITDCSFPDNLKKGDLTPVYKKGVATNKTNYRPISLLPTVSKIFERIMLNQITTYMNEYLSPFLCG